MSVLEAAVRRRADTGTICSVGFGHREKNTRRKESPTYWGEVMTQL